MRLYSLYIHTYDNIRLHILIYACVYLHACAPYIFAHMYGARERGTSRETPIFFENFRCGPRRGLKPSS